MSEPRYEKPKIQPFSGSPGRYRRADWVEEREIERWERENEQEEDDRSSDDDD